MRKEFHTIQFTCDPEVSEILIAELAGIDFESFSEDETGFTASIGSENYNNEKFDQIISSYNVLFEFNYLVKVVEEKNWNEEWEKNFPPIIVDDYCRIRASFHEPNPEIPLEIVINPKMSFGTGHHDTTYLMVSNLIELDLHRKVVVDAGCGTSILSIAAEKLGAEIIFGFDIDSWAYENALENISLNHCDKIRVYQGDVSTIKDFQPYDLVLANINRNIILQDFKEYVSKLKAGGEIILSGFLKEDEEIILKEASQLNLELVKSKSRNQWLSLVFKEKTK